MSGYLQRLLAHGSAMGSVTTGRARPQATLPYHVDAITSDSQAPFGGTSERDLFPTTQPGSSSDSGTTDPATMLEPDRNAEGDEGMPRPSSPRPHSTSRSRSHHSQRPRRDRPMGVPLSPDDPRQLEPVDAGGPVDARPLSPVEGDASTTGVAGRGEMRGQTRDRAEPPVMPVATSSMTASRTASSGAAGREFRLLPDIRSVTPVRGEVQAMASRDVGVRIDPRAVADRRAASSREALGDGAPTEVHVTIGRIEVTAMHAPVPPTRQSRPSRQPMSLDDYLSRRKGSDA